MLLVFALLHCLHTTPNSGVLLFSEHLQGQRVGQSDFEKDPIITAALIAAMGFGSGKIWENIFRGTELGNLYQVIVGAVMGVAIDNLEYQNGTISQIADVGNWYGKIKWNDRTGNVIAQDYYGFEKDYTTVLKIQQVHRIIDKSTGRVLISHLVMPRTFATHPNFATNPKISLSLTDFGAFD